MEGFLPDQLKVSFISTQSPLNVQGKITVSVYYAVPNQSMTMISNSTFDATVATITPAQQLNAQQSTRVYNVPDALNKYLHLARWIPTANDFGMDLLMPVQNGTGASLNLTYAFVVLNFEGCTASTQIGQIYLTSCASFKPASVLGGLYDTKIRGAYEGTHRVIHQLRKKRIPVNFISEE